MNILYITITQTIRLAFYTRVVLPAGNCDNDRRDDRREVHRSFALFPTAPNHLFFVEACQMGVEKLALQNNDRPTYWCIVCAT